MKEVCILVLPCSKSCCKLAYEQFCFINSSQTWVGIRITWRTWRIMDGWVLSSKLYKSGRGRSPTIFNYNRFPGGANAVSTGVTHWECCATRFSLRFPRLAKINFLWSATLFWDYFNEVGLKYQCRKPQADIYGSQSLCWTTMNIRKSRNYFCFHF